VPGNYHELAKWVPFNKTNNINILLYRVRAKERAV